MKNLKQLSAITMCALFAAMQVSFANIDTGLGAGIGGATIINGGAGYDGITGQGTNNVGLNFNGNSHVQWDTLNINNGETLNFNSTGANNLTILNTVNQGMSKIYGQIKTNDGIGNLIISNPNGVLFDGAKFATTGDVMVTTKDMSNVNVNNITDGTWSKFIDTDTKNLVTVQVLNDSNLSAGGEFRIIAPKIVGRNSAITAGKGLKLITANGADYAAKNLEIKENKGVTELKAMNINGNIEIVNNVGALSISDGTKITGDLKAEVGGLGYIYGVDETNRLNISGDVDLTGHGQQLILRNANVDGNVTMKNDGGAIELRNAKVGKDANLTTTGWQDVNHKKFNHYVHVNGNTEVGGDMNISSSQNIHIGNYGVTNNPYDANKTSNHWEGNLLPGKLTVGGDLKAEVTQGGHIMTTIDTSAKNVDFTAKSYKVGDRTYGGNILSDDKSVISADTYKFKSDGYIGGLKTAGGQTVDNKIVDIMEEYTFIPADTTDHEYMTIAGGTISKIDTPKKSAKGNDVQVYIKSNNDLLVNGANAGVINLVAPDKKITITGDDVQAKEINVDGLTKTLQLDFPSRKFTTNYTSIKTKDVVTINPDEEITYDLTNGPEGYNSPDYEPKNGTTTTYLVGPDQPVPPPGPDPKPDRKTPPDDDNVRVRNWVPDDPTKPMASTPVAYAADLDEDDPSPCRKNVDGSVTVVRAIPMAN